MAAHGSYSFAPGQADGPELLSPSGRPALPPEQRTLRAMLAELQVSWPTGTARGKGKALLSFSRHQGKAGFLTLKQCLSVLRCIRLCFHCLFLPKTVSFLAAPQAHRRNLSQGSVARR